MRLLVDLLPLSWERVSYNSTEQYNDLSCYTQSHTLATPRHVSCVPIELVVVMDIILGVWYTVVCVMCGPYIG